MIAVRLDTWFFYLAGRLTVAFQAIQGLLSADLVGPFGFGCRLRFCALWETEAEGLLVGFRSTGPSLL